MLHAPSLTTLAAASLLLVIFSPCEGFSGEPEELTAADGFVEELSRPYKSCGSSTDLSGLCDNQTATYCIVTKPHTYDSQHCTFVSDKLQLWIKPTGTLECDQPCTDRYYEGLGCGCSITLNFSKGVWLDP